MAAAVVRRFPDAETMSRAAADFVAEESRAAVAGRGRFTLVLAGGGTPRRLYELLAAPPHRAGVDWTKAHFFWGDERCVPPEHPESNFRLAGEALLAGLGLPEANTRRIHGELGAAAAAERYAADLAAFFGDRTGPPCFDCVLLGLGRDGHTASLFPGHAALDEQTRWAVPVFAPKASPALDRVTLTLPVFNQARTVLFLAAGADKAEPLALALTAAPDGEPLPAARVRPRGKLIWFVDEAAGRLIQATD